MVNSLYIKQPIKQQLLHTQRIINRFFRYEDKYVEIIRKIDIKDMSNESKTLMYCILTLRGLDLMLERYPNLKGIKDTKPLENQLILQDNPVLRIGDLYPIYREYNIII